MKRNDGKIRIKIEEPEPDYLVENEFGVNLLDVYAINYYGVLVFFQVCGLGKKDVRLFELSCMRKGTKTILHPGLEAARKPMVIMDNNTFTKSKYKVRPVVIEGKVMLPIEIRNGMPVIGTARQFGSDSLMEGVAYARKVNITGRLMAWETEPVKKKKVYLA